MLVSRREDSNLLFVHVSVAPRDQTMTCPCLLAPREQQIRLRLCKCLMSHRENTNGLFNDSQFFPRPQDPTQPEVNLQSDGDLTPATILNIHDRRLIYSPNAKVKFGRDGVSASLRTSLTKNDKK